MPRSEEDVVTERLRLTGVVARLYHVHGVRQREIGSRLGISQARVSRLLHQAEELGLVRTVVSVPVGLHPELEEAVESLWGVCEVHVIDVASDRSLATALGQASARQLGDSLAGAATVGFTSWSTTLQAMASAMQEQPRTGVRHVVEMLGDLGSPTLQHAAARSTQEMAAAVGGEPVFLRTPGVAASSALRDAAVHDVHVQRALALLDGLDVAFVGVGPPEVDSQLHAGDNYFSLAQLAEVRLAGAVSQLNQRFLDASGRPLPTPLNDLVVGVSLSQLTAARRRVVVAGGPEKLEPIAAALRGGWIDVLVTDRGTATHLVSSPMTSRGLWSRNSSRSIQIRTVNK